MLYSPHHSLITVKSENDGRSILSMSSAGSATLVDTVSQRSSATISNAGNTQQYRKFTSAVGKPGQARETREFVSRALNSANPLRQLPMSTPMDYEKFILEKNAQLEHDKDRDLLLFLRDDISQSEFFSKERTAVSSVTPQQLREAKWLLSLDALKHYSSSCKTINFNYANFAGDFKKLELTQGLNHLLFESDIALEEEKSLLNGQQLSSDIIKEGFLVVVPGENSFVDNFRSEKKRYCVLRRDNDGRVVIEVLKQQSQQTPQQQQAQLAGTSSSNQPPLEIKNAILKNTKKGKMVLQVSGNPESDKRVLILAAEADAELSMWMVQIDRAISLNYREDSLSMTSSSRGASVQPHSLSTGGDTESVTSDESSTSLRDLGMAWKGRNVAAKALNPPIVERRNVFSLYWDLEPLSDPPGKSSFLVLSSANEQKMNRNIAKGAPLATFETPTKNFNLPQSTPPTTPVREDVKELSSSPSPSVSSMLDEKPMILFVAEFKRLNIRVSVAGGTPEQIEPFFVKLFLFDAGTGTRISEEFHADVYPPSSSFFYSNGSTTPTSTSSFEYRQNSENMGNDEKLNGIDRRLILHPDANKLICSIPNPRPDIFLVAKVERLVSDCPFDIYVRGSVEAKNAAKIAKSINAAAQRLSRYRSIFAFAARPVFPSMCNTGGAFGDSRCLSLLKCEGRLTDMDLHKIFAEFSKLEKSGKLNVIPGASLIVDAEITSTVSDLQMRISPSLLPLRPWRAPSDSPLTPAFELQPFVQESICSEPFKSYMNLLYVNPISLNYGGQKSFSRARNIACAVRFVSSTHRNAENINAIIDRTDPNGPYVQSKICAVQYHEQNPQFNDEIKVQLPCSLDAADHLLFTFTHISVANALSPKSANESFESPIGYAWLPLVHHSEGLNYLAMSEDVQNFDLSIAINLPSGYIKCSHYLPAGSAVNSGAPEIKYVDNGRPLFRVRLRLISSIFSTDHCVQSFFQTYKALEHAGVIFKPLQYVEKYAIQKEKSTSSFTSNINSNCVPHQNRLYSTCAAVTESSADRDFELSFFDKEDACRRIIAKVKSLATTDIYHLIPFLNPILHRLLVLLTCSPNDEVALNVLNVIIVIVDRVAEVKSRCEFLRDFVYLHAHYVTSSAENEMTTHDALCKYIPALVRNVQGDSKAMSIIFRQLSFLLDCVVKFMAQYSIENKLFKLSRRDRFPTEFTFRVESFLQYLINQIVSKHRDLPSESKQANIAMACFLKYCLSLMDRYIIMNQIHYIIDKLDSNDSRALRSYKLDLLRVISGHEHWIPLCLPLLTDKSGSVMRSDSSAISASSDSAPTSAKSSGGILSKFFAQIFSTSAAVQESSEADRYVNYLEHFYLCPIYFQTHFLCGILLQELIFALRDSRDHRRQMIMLLRNLLAKHSADIRYTNSSAQNRIVVLYTPIIRIAIENIRELETAAKVSADSPDNSPLLSIQNTNVYQMKSRTLTSENRSSGASLAAFGGKNARSSVSANSKAATLPPQMLSQSLTNAAYSTPSTSDVHTLNAPLNNATPVVFAERLSKQEARDIILCVLYVLDRLPKRTLGALWCAQETIKSNSESSSLSLTGADTEKHGNSSHHDSSTNANSTNVYLDFIQMLELALFMFRYRGRSYHVREQAKRQRCPSKTLVNFQSSSDQQRYCTSDTQFSGSLNVSSTASGSASNALNDVDEVSSDGAPTAMSFLQDCHLTQEVALIVLDTAQTLANQIATRAKQINTETIDAAFHRLLKLKIQLLDVSWPETVRLHSLAALAVFINLFSAQFFQSGPLDCLSLLIEAILLQLNSRFTRVQNAAAALLQLILRSGFDAVSSVYGKQTDFFDSRYQRSNSFALGNSVVERLGRPGTQTGVALAHLLSSGQKHPLLLTSTEGRFERGLGALESFMVNYGDRRGSSSVFERGVLELIKQLRGVLEATSALSEAANDPIRLAELHIQLANSYRGSAALRCAWFDTLANIHISERWYAEAAVCQAHAIAIIGKELVVKGEIKIDWNLLDVVNADIATEESVYEQQLDTTQQAGYTLENFTAKVEQTLQTLVLSERYEAVGPLCRLIIPIYESAFNYKALVSLYVELQQSYSRAAEIKISGKRHLGSYFRVMFFSTHYFGSEHKSEWIYREPRLTSLAEACDRMVELLRHSLNHENVEILPPDHEAEANVDTLKPTTAYVQMRHVEPCSMARLDPQRQQSLLARKASNSEVNSKESTTTCNPPLNTVEDSSDPMAYQLHTNVRTFVYEERITDKVAPSNAPEQARLALKRIVLTTEKSFPNTKRRQRVVGRTEFTLTPLDVACDSLIFKASQIRRILNAAGMTRGAYGFDKNALRRLDVKQLQLFLQGSVSPTVNAGVLSYAEAFSAPAQKVRYGTAGTTKLISAFKILMTELAEALQVNEAAMGNERSEYQSMLRNSFDGMLERLSVFFEDEKFVLTHKASTDNFGSDCADMATAGANNIFGIIAGTSATGVLDSSMATSRQNPAPNASMHVLDSIGGLNT